MHEKLAEEMVILAQNLKENVRAAGKIVRDDKEVVAEKTLRIGEYSKEPFEKFLLHFLIISSLFK